MKIIGITYYDGSENLVLKSDSSLLVNRKPLFVPERISDLQALPCVVLRVSRLGKCVAPRYASRYYDAVAPGLDFFAADLLREAKKQGRPWTPAMAFEGSLAVGEWKDVDAFPLITTWHVMRGEKRVGEIAWQTHADCLDNAVAQASEMLTIRQGDLIYLAYQGAPLQLQNEDIVHCTDGNAETLYCKIK